MTIRIHDAEDCKKMITFRKDGYVFDTGKGHKNYGNLTPKGYSEVSKLYVQGTISAIEKIIPLNWCDLDIYLVPMQMLAYDEKKDEIIGSGVGGQSWKGTITLGAIYGEVKFEYIASVILHEIGHEIAYRFIDDAPFDFIDSAEYKEFKKLAGIERYTENDLFWNKRPSEILAETIRYFVALENPMFSYNPFEVFEGKNAPKPSREAYEYILSLINKAPIEEEEVKEEDTMAYFKDTEGRSSAGAIKFLKDKGITNGYPDGTFKPTQQITREEVAIMIARSLGYVEKK